jgi:II/X family phage/plasmid replication protein
VFSISPGGEIEWTTHKRMALTGSFAVDLQVRTAPNTLDRSSHLEISGNPVKWFQGHNLWGTDDLPGLVLATLERVAQLLGLTVSDETRAQWIAGDVALKRVDYNQSFHLANLSECLAWIHAAEKTGYLARRGSGILKGNTLYFGKNSRRWSIKLYAKGQELRAKGRDALDLLARPSVREWADRSLRVELTLRRMTLEDRNLAWVRDWLPVDGLPSSASVEEFLHHQLGNLTMTTTSGIPADVLESLTNAQRLAIAAWRAGTDLRAELPNGSFYRLRSKLLPHGIDIAKVNPVANSNVVPLHRVLEAKPVSVPDWAIGTPLYFEPPRLVV